MRGVAQNRNKVWVTIIGMLSAKYRFLESGSDFRLRMNHQNETLAQAFFCNVKM